jgi:hypothetical protein
MKIVRSFAGLAAVLAASCFIANPVDAGAGDCSQRGHCVKAQKKRLVTQATYVRRKAAPRGSVRRRAERAQFSVVWHGWAGSFHLDGVSYAGGNPRGPAAWYNNWEGGFHPEVFWVLHARNN